MAAWYTASRWVRAHMQQTMPPKKDLPLYFWKLLKWARAEDGGSGEERQEEEWPEDEGWPEAGEGDRRQVSTEATREGFLNFGMFVIQVPVVWADPNLTIQFKRVIVTCLGWFLGW